MKHVRLGVRGSSAYLLPPLAANGDRTVAGASHWYDRNFLDSSHAGRKQSHGSADGPSRDGDRIPLVAAAGSSPSASGGPSSGERTAAETLKPARGGPPADRAGGLPPLSESEKPESCDL